MKKKKVILSSLVVILLIGGGSFTVLHNQKVQADRIAQEKHDALVKQENKNLATAKDTIKLAYKTKLGKDVKSATSAISKLDMHQKKEKEDLTNQLTKLTGLIKQVSDINLALDRAVKSKSDTDIKAVQILLDKSSDATIKAEKEASQKKLTDLKNQISAEKLKAEEEKKAQEAAQIQAQQEQVASAQVENKQTTTEQAPNNQSTAPTYSQNSSYQASTPSYQAPPSNNSQNAVAPAPNNNVPHYAHSANEHDPSLGKYNWDPVNGHTPDGDIIFRW